MSDETASRPEPRPGREVHEHVTRRVERLQAAYLGEGAWSSDARRQLAELRRATGAVGATDPRTWTIVLDGLPESLQRGAGFSLATPSRAEIAVHTALTTYATHQQSQSQPMHRRGVNLGQATRTVAQRRARADSPGGLDSPTVDRLHRVSMAQTQELRNQSLRALVQLMRTESVALDYGRLAEDLYWLQDPRRATSVHLAWGRGLHRATRDDPESALQPGEQELTDMPSTYTDTDTDTTIEGDA